MRTLFKEADKNRNTFILADHLPKGRVWSNGFNPDSNLGKLIRGLCVEFYRLELMTNNISNEIDIEKTIQLIEDWEESVGIPNKCFDRNATIERRREQVLQLLSNFGGVQTKEDFVRVALLFGLDISVNIIPAVTVGSFPLEFPILFFDSTRAVTHTIFIYITSSLEGDDFFPLEFPIPFSSGGTTLLQCIFDVLAPANVQVIVRDTIE